MQIVPLEMREDSPFGNTSHNLAATNAQGLSQLNCKWTSGNPTTETGSLSVAVSQHSDKASSRRWSTGSSSRLNAKGRPHHDPLRKEVLIITLVSDSLSTFFSLPSDSGAKRLSSWRVSSCSSTFDEGQLSSAIHWPGQTSSLCAFEMPVNRSCSTKVQYLTIEIIHW